MRKAFLNSLGAALVWAGASAAVAAPAAPRIVFVGCPILRNTALPCWMGKAGDELYYMGPQTDLTSDFYPPQFRHQMLVEAEVADGPRICGGVPLRNVHVSVLPDIDNACNVILPAEGYPDPPNNRGTGPSGVRGGKPPEERQRPAPPPLPTGPFEAKEFVATFDADTARKWRPATQAINAAARYAQASKAARVEVVGHRAAIALSNGRDYVERETIAEARAREVEEALKVIGLPAETKLDVKWDKSPSPATGTQKDVEARKVVIRVIPGAGATKTAAR